MNNAILEKKIQQGYLKSRLMTRQYAKTFYFSSCFLPREKQNAAYSVYAICRISDESVDGKEQNSPVDTLNSVREKIETAYTGRTLEDEILMSFRETVNRYEIPENYFRELLKGMFMDLHKTRYENFEELYKYCYRAAGVVGLIMLKIFGYKNSQTEKHAVSLGIAMQLTNILRDIKEDFHRGRIYLPLDEMKKFGITENDIAAEIVNESFVNLLKFQIQRVRNYYQLSAPGIKSIKNLQSRFVVCTMKEIYAGILESIEKNGYDVFSRRACVTAAGKIARVARILTGGQYL